MVSSFHFVNSPLLQTGNGWDLKITQGFCCKRQCGYNLYSFNRYTALFTVVSVLIINIVSFAIAMALTKGIRGTNLFRTVFFLPNLIGGIVLSYVWLMIFNSILQNYSKTIVSSEWSAFWGLIAVVCWQQIGYMMIIYIAGIQNIPGELIEAAKIDGANRWQLLKSVILPMLMPTITICTFDIDKRLQAVRPELSSYRR